MSKGSPVKGWTEARYWGFVRSHLRKSFSRYPNKYRVLAESKEGRNQYRCAGCDKLHGNKDVCVDHIDPCGTLKLYTDLPSFVEKMLCDINGLQVLCKKCHYTKTMHERGLDDIDIAVVGFRKEPAKEQKFILTQLGVEPASNQEKRIAQYRGTL